MSRSRPRRLRLGQMTPLPVPRGLRCDRVLHEGEQYLVMNFPTDGHADASERGPWCLTAAERAVAAAAAAGRSNRQIAQDRGVSIRTVANQLASVYQKLGINSRAELAAWWHGAFAAPE